MKNTELTKVIKNDTLRTKDFTIILKLWNGRCLGYEEGMYLEVEVMHGKFKLEDLVIAEKENTIATKLNKKKYYTDLAMEKTDINFTKMIKEIDKLNKSLTKKFPSANIISTTCKLTGI